MNKKILIYMPINKLAPVGGPRGYLYHLKNQLDKLEVDNIEFLPAIEDGWKIDKFIPLIKSVRTSWNIIFSQYYALSNLSHVSKIDLSKYDIIHFHDTFSMFSVRDSLKKYNGKVVLTSHSPTILSKEWRDEASKWKKRFCKRMLDRLIKMDEYSFNRADYIFFPCEEAEEPYYNNWEDFKCIKSQNSDKFRYIPSGINACFPKLTRQEVFDKYNIPKDSIVFSYVGRHNEIKGYDNLKQIGQSILSSYSNVYFLIAGMQKPLSGLNHPRWIEVGWTNDPHSLIAASDAFILPNKETYFDLIMLEVLSLGKIVIASNTGGNKYFNRWKNSGIFLYDNINQALEIMSKIRKLSVEDKENLEHNISHIFFENFTISMFTNRYLELMKTL